MKLDQFEDFHHALTVRCQENIFSIAPAHRTDELRSSFFLLRSICGDVVRALRRSGVVLIVEFVAEQRSRDLSLIEMNGVRFTSADDVPGRHGQADEVLLVDMATIGAKTLPFGHSPQSQLTVGRCRDDFIVRDESSVGHGLLVSLEEIARLARVAKIEIVEIVISSAKDDVVLRIRLEFDTANVRFRIDGRHRIIVVHRPDFH